MSLYINITINVSPSIHVIHHDANGCQLSSPSRSYELEHKTARFPSSLMLSDIQSLI